MATMEVLLEGLPGDVEQKTWAQRIATMPMRMGGLGLRSATRMSPAAYCASWADALHMTSQRLPEVANDIVTQLAEEPAGCLAELQSAANDLDRCGFVGRPSWEALKAGARPLAPEVTEPGEWFQGWQHHASSFFRVPQPGDHGVVSVVGCRPGRIQVQARVPCSTDPQLSWSTKCNPDHRSTVRVRFSVG